MGSIFNQGDQFSTNGIYEKGSIFDQSNQRDQFSIKRINVQPMGSIFTRWVQFSVIPKDQFSIKQGLNLLLKAFNSKSKGSILSQRNQLEK